MLITDFYISEKTKLSMKRNKVIKCQRMSKHFEECKKIQIMSNNVKNSNKKVKECHRISKIQMVSKKV